MSPSPAKHATRLELCLSATERENTSYLTEITGAETLAGDSRPHDALIGFYPAFNAGELNGLAASRADPPEKNDLDFEGIRPG